AAFVSFSSDTSRAAFVSFSSDTSRAAFACFSSDSHPPRRTEEEVRQGLLSALTRDPARSRMADLGAAVAAGRLTPEAAAAELLSALS
ncbi:MAG: hypothetical protein RL354_2275, partial [Planctomycetota bacterium]